MPLIGTQLTALDGQPLDLAELRDHAVLVVNVASRIDESFMGRAEYLALVEDTAERWLKFPTPADAEVEVARSVD
jgi:glutathione peroxidase-family protein